MNRIFYSQVGDNYQTKDPIKVMALKEAKKTSVNLLNNGFRELEESRGESAYVWEQDKVLMASVIEGLGTKNLVADEMRKITGKTYYDVIGHDTVATIINDLSSVGAKPLVIHAYWAIENNEWLGDKKRMTDLIHGWKKACDLSGAAWGGGETPTLKGIIKEDTIELGGSAVGIIKNKNNYLCEDKLQAGDRILLLKSNGINANGLSLARAIAAKLKDGYKTKLPNGKIYGDKILRKTNIYALLIQKLLEKGINLHYISNITGHGLRKIMRPKKTFTYILEKIYPKPVLFQFIQKEAQLSDNEMYGTFNMGMDYALYLPAKDVLKSQKIISDFKFSSLDAGYLEKGKRQVIIKPKNIVYKDESLKLR